jgi:hypothetical protein
MTLEKFLTVRMLCERYNVVSRTIDRWIVAEILPPPTWIRGRRYWPASALEQLEHAAVGKRRDCMVAQTEAA